MFRRRPKGQRAPDDPGPDQDSAPDAAAQEDEAPSKPERPHGPWDVDELDDRPSHTAPRLDLGGLRIRPLAGMRVQMQVDQSTGKSTSVLLVSEQAAVQLMAIAAAKSTPLWPQTKAALYADAMRRGGSAKEGDGPWGPVLRMTLPAQSSDGAKGVQPSVVIGIDGPRWLLRATLIGKAAIDQEQMNRLMSIVQDTVVVRGSDPMAPGEIIALTPPPRPESAVDVDEPPETATGSAATEATTPEAEQPRG